MARTPNDATRVLAAALLGLALGLPAFGETPAHPQHGEAAAPARWVHPELLVETEQLAQWAADPAKLRETDEKLVLIDGRRAEEYAVQHLDGAWNLESDAFQAPDRPPHFLPDAKKVEELADKFGICEDSRIVIYDAHGGRLAARIWFTFYAYGHDHASILNGGLPKWIDEKRAVVKKPSEKRLRNGSWKPAGTLRGVAAIQDLAKYKPETDASGIPYATLVDARTYGEFMGRDNRAKHGGHIPGAVNIPYESLVVEVNALRPDAVGAKTYPVWKQAPVVHAIVRTAGVVPERPACAYDQSGGRAAHVMFTLMLLGYQDPVVYVGSWREYGNREDVPIER